MQKPKHIQYEPNPEFIKSRLKKLEEAMARDGFTMEIKRNYAGSIYLEPRRTAFNGTLKAYHYTIRVSDHPPINKGIPNRSIDPLHDCVQGVWNTFIRKWKKPSIKTRKGARWNG